MLLAMRPKNSLGSTTATTTWRGRGIAPLGGGGGSQPPPGCYPVGTRCRGFYQEMVFCCPGGQTWSRQEGWCVGYWDAMPCR